MPLTPMLADHGEATTVVQLGSARAYECIWHMALRRSMRRRGVLCLLALAYLREVGRTASTTSGKRVQAGVLGVADVVPRNKA